MLCVLIFFFKCNITCWLCLCIFCLKCHESRSLVRNRAIARERLKQKLDYLYNGNKSVLAQNIAKKKKRKADYARKRRKREEALGANQLIIEDGPKANHEEG